MRTGYGKAPGSARGNFAAQAPHRVRYRAVTTALSYWPATWPAGCDRGQACRPADHQPGLQGRVLTDLAQAVAAADPDRAKQLAADAARSITDEYWKAWALADAVRAVAAADPGRAAYIAWSIGRFPLNARVLTGLARAVAAADPSRAERIAWSIIDPDSKARALADAAAVVAATDPGRAERIARKIPYASYSPEIDEFHR
jgi:hypothetical protein